jgi:hypothetical protein
MALTVDADAGARVHATDSRGRSALSVALRLPDPRARAAVTQALLASSAAPGSASDPADPGLDSVQALLNPLLRLLHEQQCLAGDMQRQLEEAGALPTSDPSDPTSAQNSVVLALAVEARGARARAERRRWLTHLQHAG